MKEVKSGENQVGYLQNCSHCQPRLKPQVSSLAIQGTPAAAFPNPCPYHLGIPQTISSSYLPSLVALTQTPVPAGTPYELKGCCSQGKKKAEGKPSSFLLFFRFNPPSLIHSSIAGNLLWFPSPLWPHTPKITKIFSSNRIHPSAASKTYTSTSKINIASVRVKTEKRYPMQMNIRSKLT